MDFEFPDLLGNLKHNWSIDYNVDTFFDWMYNNPFADWMTDGDWNETKYRQFSILYATPLRYYMDAVLDARAGKEYLDRFGMDYTDIHDPRRLTGTSGTSAFLRHGYSMISKNIEDLYR